MQVSVYPFIHSFTQHIFFEHRLNGKHSLGPGDTVSNKQSLCSHDPYILVYLGQIKIFCLVLSAVRENQAAGGREGCGKGELRICLHLSRDVIASEEEPCDSLGRELSRPRGQPVKEPGAGSVFGVLQETPGLLEQQEGWMRGQGGEVQVAAVRPGSRDP